MCQGYEHKADNPANIMYHQLVYVKTCTSFSRDKYVIFTQDGFAKTAEFHGLMAIYVKYTNTLSLSN